MTLWENYAKCSQGSERRDLPGNSRAKPGKITYPIESNWTDLISNVLVHSKTFDPQPKEEYKLSAINVKSEFCPVCRIPDSNTSRARAIPVLSGRWESDIWAATRK